jgi:hypothetical protein
MSTILDALNKLDDEKKRSEASQNAGDASFIDPEDAAKEIIGKDVMRDELTFKLSPLQIIGAIGVAALTVVVVAVSLVIYMMRSDRAQPVVGNQPADTPVAVAVAVPGVEEATPISDTDNESLIETLPSSIPPKKNSTLAPDPVSGSPSQQTEKISEPVPEKAKPTLAPPEEVGIPETVAEKTAEIIAPPTIDKPLEEETPVAEKVKPVPDTILEIESDTSPLTIPESNMSREESYQIAQKSKSEIADVGPNVIGEDKVVVPSQPEDIRKFPVLSRAVLSRFDLNKVRINMCNPKTNTNPFPNAIVNMIKLDVGDTLAGTGLELTHVEKYGVAFQDRRTGQQYYLKY